MIEYEKQAKRWLSQANEDMMAAQELFTSKKFAHACFFAEQSCQKSLKGYLIGNKKQPSHIHAITDLIIEAGIIHDDFMTLLNDAKMLDKYYLTTRYPDALPDSSLTPSEAYTAEEAEKAIEIAQRIFAQSSVRR
ncbi:MAG: HEPN domain-containing protein [bacterium]|nr:HEPN domain-containing protein [bacterium]